MARVYDDIVHFFKKNGVDLEDAGGIDCDIEVHTYLGALWASVQAMRDNPLQDLITDLIREVRYSQRLEREVQSLRQAGRKDRTIVSILAKVLSWFRSDYDNYGGRSTQDCVLAGCPNELAALLQRADAEVLTYLREQMKELVDTPIKKG